MEFGSFAPRELWMQHYSTSDLPFLGGECSLIVKAIGFPFFPPSFVSNELIFT